MRSLRKLWGFALAAIAWALVMGCWLLPGRADATVPQAPNQQSALTISAAANGNTLSISGSLTAGGKPISGAEIIITLDTQTLGKVPTGGDGSYSTSTKLPDVGAHVVTATFAGDTTNRPDSATQRFAVAAPATTAAPTTVITAQLSPNPVAAGSVLVVSGTLASAGVPIDSARVDISCDFGSGSALGVTDAGGAFTANLALPATGQPAKLTVTVSYAGDNRFAPARATFQASVTAAATPSVATPSIPPSAHRLLDRAGQLHALGGLVLRSDDAPQRDHSRCHRRRRPRHRGGRRVHRAGRALGARLASPRPPTR